MYFLKRILGFAAPLLLSLIILIPTKSYSIGMWESFAEKSFYTFKKTCPQNSANLNCIDPKAPKSPTDSLQSVRELAYNKYLSTLAEGRIQAHMCAVSFIRQTTSSDTQTMAFSKRIEQKVQLLSKMLAQALKLDRDLSQALRHKKARKSQHKNSSTIDLQDRLNRLLIAIHAVETSIPLGSSQNVQQIVRAHLKKSLARAETLAAQQDEPERLIQPIDSMQFMSDLKNALLKTHLQVAEEVSILQDGVNSNGLSLDRKTKESLAQDIILIEKMRAQKPERLKPDIISCEVDAIYGDGAKLRDQFITGGSVAFTFGSLGMGLLMRSGSWLYKMYGASKYAAGIGAVSLRSSQVIGLTAAGLGALDTMLSIDSSCFNKSHTTEVRIKNEKNNCIDFSLQSLEQEDCVLNASLTLLTPWVAPAAKIARPAFKFEKEQASNSVQNLWIGARISNPNFNFKFINAKDPISRRQELTNEIGQLAQDIPINTVNSKNTKWTYETKNYLDHIDFNSDTPIGISKNPQSGKIIIEFPSPSHQGEISPSGTLSLNQIVIDPKGGYWRRIRDEQWDLDSYSPRYTGDFYTNADGGTNKFASRIYHDEKIYYRFKYPDLADDILEGYQLEIRFIDNSLGKLGGNFLKSEDYKTYRAERAHWDKLYKERLENIIKNDPEKLKIYKFMTEELAPQYKREYDQTVSEYLRTTHFALPK